MGFQASAFQNKVLGQHKGFQIPAGTLPLPKPGKAECFLDFEYGIEDELVLEDNSGFLILEYCDEYNFPIGHSLGSDFGRRAAPNRYIIGRR